METFVEIKEKNRKEAINLMRVNNVTKIDFIDENHNLTINYIPLVLYDNDDEFVDLFIQSVSIDENNQLFVKPAIGEKLNMEFNVRDAEYNTDNNIYLAIGKYFETV